MGKDLRGKELGQGLYQTENGTYRARFTYLDKQYTNTFDKLSEAREWLAETKYDCSHSGIAASTHMTVDTWFDYWLDKIISPRLKYNTIVSYRGRYSSKISPHIGMMQISEVKPLHCQHVLNAAQEDGEVPGSVSKLKSIMHAMFDSAVENQLIPTNPITKSVKYVHGKCEKRTILTVDQQEDFMREGEGYVHFDAFVFVLNTGLRCGEMQALRWQDVDWANRLIYVKGTMYHDRNTHEFVVNSPKTKAGIRTIPLTEGAFNVLMMKKEAQKGRPVSMQYREYIFTGSDGIPLNTKAYNKCLSRISAKIGVPKLTMHSLRHTFATRCLENGMKPKVLQEILGHASISMTMDLYVHVTEDEKISEMRKLILPRAMGG